MGATRVRYQVVTLTVLLAMVTYLDRVCISKLAPDIMRDLGLSKMQMGYVFSRSRWRTRCSKSHGVVGRPTGHAPGAHAHRDLVVGVHHRDGGGLQLRRCC